MNKSLVHYIPERELLANLEKLHPGSFSKRQVFLFGGFVGLITGFIVMGIVPYWQLLTYLYYR